MTRFGFDIRTRAGQPVANVNILASTRDDAERRLRQMYHACVITQCRSESVSDRANSLDVTAVIGMISDYPTKPACDSSSTNAA